jgi:hypothetical protein
LSERYTNPLAVTTAPASLAAAAAASDWAKAGALSEAASKVKARKREVAEVMSISLKVKKHSILEKRIVILFEKNQQVTNKGFKVVCKDLY